MSGLAHYFEAEGFATVLVGFVREHIELIKPPRALWLDFPMGRPMGKPNDPEYQLKVIRAAFELFDAPSGPVLEDFPDVIPVKDGRMGYALPPEFVYSTDDIGDVDVLLAEVQAEVEGLREFVACMLDLGISPDDITTMIRSNPERLLGLPAFAPEDHEQERVAT